MNVPQVKVKACAEIVIEFTAVPSRNYIVGQSIEVLFDAGEVAEVVGGQAIGVYLEPRDSE